MSDGRADWSQLPAALRVASRMLAPENRDYIIGDLLETHEAESAWIGSSGASRRLWSELSTAILLGAFVKVKRERSRLSVAALILLGLGVALHTRASALRDSGPSGFHVAWASVENDGLDWEATNASSGILLKPVTVGVNQPAGHAFHAVYSLPEAHRSLDPLPLIGRILGPGDDRSEVRSAVLMEDAWRDFYGESPDVLGRTISVDGETVQIVGVVSIDFDWMTTPPHFWIASALSDVAALADL